MQISIIIPVLNESAAISGTLDHLQKVAPTAELLVVDGGSEDGTPDIVRKTCPQARLLESHRGRARQMNLGAQEAGGDWLLFLHGDTRLPDGFLQALDRAEADGFEVGAFGLWIDGRHPLLPLLSWGATWRTRLRRIFLGDQAPFMRRQLFDRMGGFPLLSLMEDYEFSRRLRKNRIPLFVSPLRVSTSGRRWDKGGFFRTWLLMRWIYFYYHWRGTTELPASRYHHQR